KAASVALFPLRPSYFPGRPDMNTRVPVVVALILAFLPGWTQSAADPIPLGKQAHIVLLGNGLGSRMIHYGQFDTELHLRYPEQQLLIRNMCDEANTPSFRPHSARQNQLGFPGADKFAKVYCDGNLHGGKGHFDTDEQWLARL